MGLAVPGGPVGRILGPKLALAARPRDHLVGHDVLPCVRGEDHREAVEPAHTVSTVLGKLLHDLLGDFRVREVLASHREMRDVFRHERVLQIRHGLAEIALDALEAPTFLHPSLVDLARLADLRCRLGEDLDASADSPTHRDARCRPAENGRHQWCTLGCVCQCVVSAVHSNVCICHHSSLLCSLMDRWFIVAR